MAPIHRLGPDTPARLLATSAADRRHGGHGSARPDGWVVGRSAADGLHAAGYAGGATGIVNRAGLHNGAPDPELVAAAQGRHLAVAALRHRRDWRLGAGVRHRPVHPARGDGARAAREWNQGAALPRRRQQKARPARQRGLPQPGPGPAARRHRGRALARRTPHRRPAAADGSPEGRVPGAGRRRRRTRQRRRFRERHRIRPDRSRSAPPQPRPRRDGARPRPGGRPRERPQPDPFPRAGWA